MIVTLFLLKRSKYKIWYQNLSLRVNYMKIIKFLLTICLTLCFGLILVSCRSKNVSLEFLITPEEMILHSNSQLMELNKIEDKARDFIKLRNEKYEDSAKISQDDIKKAEEIQNEFLDTLNSGRKIKDKITIEDIFNQLRQLNEGKKP